GTTTVNAKFTISSIEGDATAQDYVRKLTLKVNSVEAQPFGQRLHLEFDNRELTATFVNAGSYVVQNGAPFFLRPWSQTGSVAPNTSLQLDTGTDAPYSSGTSEVLVVVPSATFTDSAGQVHTAKITSDGLTVTLS